MKEYFEEDVLVQKVQSGEMSMLDYVTHHSEQWDHEFQKYCHDHFLDEGLEESAVEFLDWKDKQLQNAHDEGAI